MEPASSASHRRLRIGLLVLVCLCFMGVLWYAVATTPLGGEDFVTYWSAASLLRDGLNPYDPAAMERLQETLAEIGADYMPMAWNPPTLFVFLLPFTLLPYTAARFAWLLMNLAIMLAASLWLARMYFPEAGQRNTFLFVLFVFSLPQVVVGIFMGQVTYLVFAGVVACLALARQGRWTAAGAVLVLTSVKPHMVLLVVLYLLLLMLRRRRFGGLIGLAAAGVFCAAVLFALRPGWLADLRGVMNIAPLHWATPTIGGLLSYLGVFEPARYLIILLLPLPFVLAHYEAKIKPELAVALLTLVTVPCTFFGWSFDQIHLLIPAAQVIAWIAGSMNRVRQVVFTACMAGGTLLAWVLRFFEINDVFFVWYPLFWWGLFGAAWLLTRREQRGAGEQAA
jgi:Glycosyltransferase family 87